MAAAAVRVERQRRSRVTVMAQWVLPLLQRLQDRSVDEGFVGHYRHGEHWFSCPDVPSYLYCAA
jgi:hypothetical protein